MYEIIKAIGIDIFVLFFGFLCVFFVLCRILLHNDSANSNVRNELDNAVKNANGTKSGINNAQETTSRIENGLSKSTDTVERLEQSNRRIEESLRESQRIFEEIKKQRIEE